ncbi:MAG: leucine-rich repeat domain-containing protein [Treponemataceae bacterium]|nr:leucine-rich repeat domain-containing protein [Treponemataceae bacterium]
MKKTWFAAIAAVVLVLAGCGSEPDEEPSPLKIEGGVLIKYEGTDEHVTIPAEVKEIGEGAFKGRTALRSVVIPDSVTIIGDNAFVGCTSLASLDLPDSVTTIGDNAFVGCTSITAVVIPDSVETIGDNVFVGCTSIRNVTISDGVTKIGSNAFSGCDSLVEIRYGGTKAQWESLGDEFGIPGGVTVHCKDGDIKTDNSSSNGDVVGIPKPSFTLENTSLYRLTATCVGRDFDAAGGLSDFGYNGSYLYYPLEIDLDKDTAELTAVVIVNEAVGKMGIGLIEVEDDGSVDSYCFATTASSIRYFGGTKAVDKDTGEPKENGWGWKDGSTLGLNKDNKPKLCSVNVPYTFRATLLEKQLTFAIIDSSGTVVGTHNSIDYKTLVNNNGKVYFAIGAISGDTSNIAYSNINVTVNGGTCTIDKIENSDGSPCVKLSLYLSVDGTTVKRYRNGVPENLVIPDGVTAISNWAFQDCPSKTIVIPDGVKSIGIGAFSNCRNLANVEIPGSVTEIGGSAFSYCSALTSVVIPDGVTTIGEYAFGECNSLTSVSIPATVTEIGFRAFPSYYSSDYYSLGLVIYYGGTAAEWQSVNKHDEDDKYDYFSKNISVLCTDTPKNLPSYLRVQGTKITGSDRDNIPANLEIPKGITEIGDSAFYYCGQLINVELPDSVTKIGRGAFQSCSALTSIVIPNNVTEIGVYAFPNKWEFDPASRLVIRYGGTSVEWQKLIENCTYDDGYDSDKYGKYALSEYITVLCSDTPTVDGSLIVQGTTITRCDWNSVPANLAIPEGITEIGYNVFNNCSLLTSVTIPATVTSIGDYAFGYCTSLASVTIGNGVKSIGRYAFYMCTNLMSVTYKGTKAQWNAITKETDWNSSTGNYTITCTDGTIAKQ